MNRVRQWAHHVRDRHACMIATSLPVRDRWTLYLAIAVTSPKLLARHLRGRFRMWTILPGDRISCYGARLVEGEVVRVRRDGLVVQVASRQFLDRGLAPDWPYSLPPNVIPAYETVRLSDLWMWTR